MAHSEENENMVQSYEYIRIRERWDQCSQNEWAYSVQHVAPAAGAAVVRSSNRPT